MRELRINKRVLYYAQYDSKVEALDADGNYTGDVVITYGHPVEFRCNISPAKGASAIGMFGISFDYSKTVTTDDMSCPMNESTVVWLELPPNIAEYSATSTYAEGTYCFHDNGIFKAAADISTAEVWNDAHWGKVPHNYVIVLVARGLWSITYALKEVEVS